MKTKTILLPMLAALPVMVVLTGAALSKARLSVAMSQIELRNPSDAGAVIASVTTAATHLDKAHAPLMWAVFLGCLAAVVFLMALTVCKKTPGDRRRQVSS